MNPKATTGRFAWLGSAASLIAVVACYGTLAAVALLAAIGASVDVNEGALVKFITALLGLAIAGMVYSFRLHRHPGPITVSLLSVIALLWVFYGTYSKPLELLGFAGLVVASLWDFRCKKKACPAPTSQGEECTAGTDHEGSS
jgi:arsenite methyltransferase